MPFRLDHSDVASWHRRLMAYGLTGAEARAWIAARVCADREEAAEWAGMSRATFETQFELAAGKFREAIDLHLLMFGPADYVGSPEGELLEEMRAAMDPAGEAVGVD